MTYAEFESIVMLENNGKQNPNESYTNNYQKHVACSYGYKLICVMISLVNLLNHIWVKMLFAILLIPIVFHNLKSNDSHLNMLELGKLNFKINVIPNRLERYMSFKIDNKLTFIDSFQFLSSSLTSLVKKVESRI